MGEDMGEDAMNSDVFAKVMQCMISIQKIGADLEEVDRQLTEIALLDPAFESNVDLSDARTTVKNAIKLIMGT